MARSRARRGVKWDNISVISCISGNGRRSISRRSDKHICRAIKSDWRIIGNVVRRKRGEVPAARRRSSGVEGENRPRPSVSAIMSEGGSRTASTSRGAVSGKAPPSEYAVHGLHDYLHVSQNIVLPYRRITVSVLGISGVFSRRVRTAEILVRVENMLVQRAPRSLP